MMNCDEFHGRFLEIVDGQVPSQDTAAVRAHLDRCPACRAEVDQLCAGARALHSAVDLLAPRQRYLTPARLERLMAARQSSRKPFRIITLHRLVAAAAIAAIVASAPFLVGDFRRLLNPPEPPPMVASIPVPAWRGPVILAATGRENPMSVRRSLSPAADASLVASSSDQGPGLAVFDTPGVRVPVENVLYDPDESSHWW
jgi:anti-sigma factor RsiW